MVHEIWLVQIVGSYTYVLSRRLELLRKKLKTCCLDKKLFWGVNWKCIFEQLQAKGTQILTLAHAVDYTQSHHPVINEATLAFSY